MIFESTEGAKNNEGSVTEVGVRVKHTHRVKARGRMTSRPVGHLQQGEVFGDLLRPERGEGMGAGPWRGAKKWERAEIILENLDALNSVQIRNKREVKIWKCGHRGGKGRN